MTVAFHTLGCKVNQVDSGTLAQRMSEVGYARAEPEKADVVVLNSCTVTAESERKTRQKLRHFRTINQSCMLVLTGCAVQVCEDAAVRYPEADLILGQRDARDLACYIDEFLLSRQQIVKITPREQGEAFDDAAHESIGRTRANVKIEDGCDRFCAYCIIPHARGPVRSKPIAALRKEVQSLAHQGFREIVLVGINLAAYGSDLDCDLGDAVLAAEQATAGTTLRRIRLGSLEPDGMTDVLLEKLSHCEALCPQFHLSLQSGSDRTLKRMNRHYSTEEYFSMVNRLRALFPGAAITTDIMVGFPGESEAAFEESLSFAKEIGFAKMHVFPFSPRPGTPAAGFSDQISKKEKQNRAKQALRLAESLNRDFLNSQIGRTLEMLPEEPCPGGGMQGFAANYAPVALPEAGPELRNQPVLARITGIEGEFCVGTLAR